MKAKSIKTPRQQVRAALTAAKASRAAFSELARWDDAFVAEHWEATGGEATEIAQVILEEVCHANF